MAKSPIYFSETLTIGRHTYLLEVKRSQRGQKYFIITQTSLRDAEQRPVIVFDRYMARFAKSVERAAKAVIGSVPELETATEREVKKRPGKAKESQPKNQGKRWTAQQDALLTARYQGGMSVAELAELLGRGTFSIEVRLAKLGLVASEN